MGTMRASLAFLSLLSAASTCAGLGARPIQLQWLQESSEPPAMLAADYPAYNLSVPVDHFHNDSLYEPHVNDTFPLRYWFDASHYRQGGPVIVLAAGETSGVGRLPFLRKGIAAKLAQATGGLAVVLEHRYYGASMPVANLSTPSLRFLRTEQALADTAYFARHVKFAGLEQADLTPGTGAPWIVYGGSYAGAFAAFLRVLYPDVFWGAISSSGVTEAIHDYWQYYEAQRLYGPPACIDTTATLVHAMDQLLAEDQMANPGRPDGAGPDDSQKQLQGRRWSPAAQLKTVFGLGNLTHNDDFATLVSSGLDGWQSRNWDPSVSSTAVDVYCRNLTAPALLFPELETQRADVEALLRTTSYRAQAAALATPLLNLVGWVQTRYRCSGSRTQDDCFGSHDPAPYRHDDLSQTWRAWPYQYCTQWGYLATGSGVPRDRLPLISRLIDVPYLSIICREAFGVTEPPDVASINRLGGFGIRYPRLAVVDGEADPWRAATPHALQGGQDRPSTTTEPFLLIGGGAVHHWDENGLLVNETTADLPPEPIRAVQAEEERFVAAWVEEWSKSRS